MRVRFKTGEQPAGAFALAVGLIVLGGTTGCDTGFGQPCDLPKTPQIRQACQETNDQADAGDGIQTASKPSCALKNYAGCETRICLVYRGSSPFCSERCSGDSDCEGNAVCRPLLGDLDLDQTACQATGDGFVPECYCVRQGDLND
ncbi:MAG: hypothetical protein KC549_05305 [Myxococcales bacterium]|nr:hypothetical protein [Myxococcales bacterium]